MEAALTKARGDAGPPGLAVQPVGREPLPVCAIRARITNENDAHKDGWLRKVEGDQYQIKEANIAPSHIDATLPDHRLAANCGLAPCTSFDADGFPDDWGGHDRDDDGATSFDESTMGACCRATENKYCFETVHFSTYEVLDPNCGADCLDRSKLKALKLDKEVGQQNIVFSTEFTVLIDDTSDEPDPAIAPLGNGFRIALVDEDKVGAHSLVR